MPDTYQILPGQTVRIGRDRLEATEPTTIPGHLIPSAPPAEAPLVAYICRAAHCEPTQRAETKRHGIIPVHVSKLNSAIFERLQCRPACAFCGAPMRLAEPGDLPTRRSRNTPPPER